MKTKNKIPHLILALSLSLFAAQSASAALVFTFSEGAPGSTIITVSGDTATVGGQGDGDQVDTIGFSAESTGPIRHRGFSRRQDTLVEFGTTYATFAALGSGTLSDSITLASTGITGGTLTTIDSYYFDSNEFYLVMEGLPIKTGPDGMANNGDTLSFIGATDVVGVMAVDFSAFQSLLGTTMNNTQDNFAFAFVPEPSSTALLGLGGLALMLRRKRS